MRKPISAEEFIIKAKDIHGDKYNYDKVVYINSKIKIIITCPEHGDWEQIPVGHLQGKGCRQCANSYTATKLKLTLENFITKACVIHEDAYDYSNSVYINAHIKIAINCKQHGNFLQSPNKHLQGRGCPSCAMHGFNPDKSAILYYLKIVTDSNQVLYKIGVTNRTVDERFNLTDLSKIEIVKQKLYKNGLEAFEWEKKLKQLYKQYKYKGPKVLKDGNTELFTEDIIKRYYESNNID